MSNWVNDEAKKDESDVVSIVETLELWLPNLYSEEQTLINICKNY